MRISSLVFNNFTKDSRVEKQAMSLSKLGYDLTVFALWDRGLQTCELKDEYKIERIKSLTPSIKSRLGKIIQFFDFSLKVSFRIRRVDLVHCHDFHPLPAVILSKLILRSKFYVIYDAHEYESEKLGLVKTSKLTIKILEKISSHFVDGFITVSGPILKTYEHLFFKIPKTLVLNCPPTWNKVSSNLLRDKFGLSGKSLIVLYQGGLMPGRAIEKIAKAFQIIDEKNLDLVYMGYPVLTKASRNTFSMILKNTQEFENIHYHEAVGSDRLYEFTGSANIGVCLIEDLCLSYKYSLPNKFFEYAMAGLPILVSDLPEMRKLVEEYDCGVVCESITPEGIVAGLRKLLSRDLSKLGKNARQMAEDHSWEVQEKKLFNLYERVLSIEVA